MKVNKYAIIVAGGEGNRAGGSIPKQFQKLAGIPMLWWSVRAFYREDKETEVILVLHPGFFDDWDLLYEELPEDDKNIPVKIVAGGRSRLESVKNGLYSIPAGAKSLVAVHDAARPLVSKRMIERGWERALEEGAVVPVVPVNDSLRKIEEDGNISVRRRDYVKVQTPQIFDADVIKAAYLLPLNSDMTDDASVVEAYGHSISLYEGEPDNFKVTNPLDIEIAGILLDRRGE